jgi:hypothetical protein
MATKLDLPSIQRGDTVPYSITWGTGAGAINMQGKSVIMTFKFSQLEYDGDAALTKTIVVAENNAEAVSGLVRFQLERSETALLTAGVTMHYAIRVITPAVPESVETTHFYGSIVVEDA